MFTVSSQGPMNTLALGLMNISPVYGSLSTVYSCATTKFLVMYEELLSNFMEVKSGLNLFSVFFAQNITWYTYKHMVVLAAIAQLATKLPDGFILI